MEVLVDGRHQSWGQKMMANNHGGRKILGSLIKLFLWKNLMRRGSGGQPDLRDHDEYYSR